MSDAYAKPEALVTTDWLADHLDDATVRVIEVDEDTNAYEKDHIRNAVGWNWFTDLHDPLRREYLDPAGLGGVLRSAGVNTDTTVVLYGGNNNWFAAYAYWLLIYSGFENVRLLDGGRKKWELESREQVADVPSFPAGEVTLAGPRREELRVLRDDVIAKIGKVGMVDVRSPDEYSGAKLAPDHLPQEQAQVPGHVPGAVNIPWNKAANEDGTFKSASELKALYEGEGITSDREIIAYCRIGERSAHTWFVLHELLGYSNVENYDGSWTDGPGAVSGIGGRPGGRRSSTGSMVSDRLSASAPPRRPNSRFDHTSQARMATLTNSAPTRKAVTRLASSSISKGRNPAVATAVRYSAHLRSRQSPTASTPSTTQ